MNLIHRDRKSAWQSILSCGAETQSYPPDMIHKRTAAQPPVSLFPRALDQSPSGMCCPHAVPIDAAKSSRCEQSGAWKKLDSTVHNSHSAPRAATCKRPCISQGSRRGLGQEIDRGVLFFSLLLFSRLSFPTVVGGGWLNRSRMPRRGFF